jgi:hypothetical protein
VVVAHLLRLLAIRASFLLMTNENLGHLYGHNILQLRNDHNSESLPIRTAQYARNGKR